MGSLPTDSPADGMMADLNVCRALFGRKDAFAFFRTSFSSSVWVPELPGREAFGPGSGLLLSALRGKGLPLSFRTDREAVDWSLSVLLEHPGEDISVLDLTRSGDLIRSRTMEAFFPLISIAAIYFLLTVLLTKLLGLIDLSLDRKHDSRKIKGVD